MNFAAGRESKSEREGGNERILIINFPFHLPFHFSLFNTNLQPMKQILRCTLLLLIIAIGGCSISHDPVTGKWVTGKYIYGNGIEARRNIPAGDFTGFNIEIMNIELWQDTVNSVVMIGDSNIISRYHTSVNEKGILTLEGQEYTILMPTHQPRLEIHMKNINYIRMSANSLTGMTPVKTNKLKLVELSLNASLDVTCDSLILDLSRHDCNPPNLLLKGSSTYTWLGLRDGAKIDALTFKGHCMDIMHDPSAIYLVNPKNYDVMHFGPKPEIDQGAE